MGWNILNHSGTVTQHNTEVYYKQIQFAERIASD